jgi:prepilin-type N-terminal cleavage/methylation domain-containing protein
MHQRPRHARPKTARTRAFTLVEVLIVIAVIGVLAALVLAVGSGVKSRARQAGCVLNLSQMGLAMQGYLRDNRDRFFPSKEVVSGQGVLWWFGFEPSNGPTAEGQRILDRTRGRLWPYYAKTDSIEICPSFATNSPNYKPKYTTNWTTYGLPLKLINAAPAAPVRVTEITHPADTVLFADCAQFNNFQAPASPSHPKYEQWYYLSRLESTVNYLHQGQAMALMFDQSVRPLTPQFGVNRTFPEAPVGRPPDNVWLQAK